MFSLVGVTGVSLSTTQKIGLSIFFIDGNDHHYDENNADVRDVVEEASSEGCFFYFAFASFFKLEFQ